MFPQYSRNRLQAWLRGAGHRGRQRAATSSARCRAASASRWTRPRPRATPATAPAALALKIVHEDDAIVVIDKPAGWSCIPAPGTRPHAANALLAHAPALAGVPRAGIVHRLDKDTSGLLVVAKTPEAQAHLVRQLAARSVKRVYLALVQGDLARRRRDRRADRARSARAHAHGGHRRGKPARTRYRVIERFGHAALLECRLETGRTHQIRVHFQPSAIRWSATRPTASRTARAIALRRADAAPAVHSPLPAPGVARGGARADPSATGERMEWRSALPADMSELVDRLRR